MRASEILSRAHRPAVPAQAARPSAAPPAAPRPEEQPQQVTVRPPQIPPLAPPPRSGSVYRQLMQKHDRMATRHVT